MATIPMTPDRSRMPGTPNLRMGTRTFTPEDLGSRQFNEYMRLGQAMGRAGTDLQQFGIRKYNEIAESEMYSAQAEAQKLINEDENRIRMLTGSAANEAPAQMGKSIEKHAESAKQNLSTPLAKSLFDRGMLGFNGNKMDGADAHMLREQEKDRVISIEAKISQQITNAAVDRYNGKAVAGYIQNIKALNSQLYRDRPPEFLAMKDRESASMVLDKVSATLAATDGPMAALDFLNSGIEVEMTGGEQASSDGKQSPMALKLDLLRKHYGNIVQATAVPKQLEQ